MLRNREAAVMAVVLLALNLALNWTLFLPGESPYRDSIEGGYMGMAKFFAAHPNPWGWNPLQYAGLPSQFVYLPLLSYASAAASALTGLPAPYAYKLITATLLCLGPVTLFLFVTVLSASRWWAFAAAAAYSVFSPLYGLVRQIDGDRGITYMPWRVHVFAKYGEGPHNAGLMLIPLALLVLWIASTRNRPLLVPVAAVLLAAVTLTNWVAALALAIMVLLLLLAAAGSGEASPRMKIVIVSGLVGYGLACFWLTPTFIRTIAFNWPLDAFNYKLQNLQRWLLAGWVAGALLLRILARLLRWPFYPTFTALGAWAFGYPVLIFYSWGVDVLPESRRYALEFGMFLILALFAFFRFGFTSPRLVRKGCAAAVLIPLLWTGSAQLRGVAGRVQGSLRPVAPESTSEYRAAEWLSRQHPKGRVLASGGLRFRLNQWFEMQQVGGAFESGLRNRMPVDFAYQIRTGRDSRLGERLNEAMRQMQALGVEYIVIHGPNSGEHYRDYKDPLLFEGVLEKVYSEGDDWIYRVPFRSLAHVIKPAEQPVAPHRDWIGGYIQATSDAGRPLLHMRWQGTREIEISGEVPAGYDVVLAVNHAEGWHALQDGSPVELARNALGYIVVKARPAAATTIRLTHGPTAEQVAFAGLSGLTWAAAGFWYFRRWRAERLPFRHAAAAGA